MITAFVNEMSLQGQYHLVDNFEDAIITFNSLLGHLPNQQCDIKIFYSPSIFNQNTIGKELFSQSINRITDKSIRTAFTILKQRLFEDWNPIQKQNGNDYYWKTINVSGTSIAECYEYQNGNGFATLLINLLNSSFNIENIEVRKENETKILSCITTFNDLIAWFKNNPIYGVVTYNNTSVIPPFDYETVLCNKSKFRKTSYTNQGRLIYLEISTKRYFCVDNFHSGKDAHLEVFDSNGNHISESLLDGELIQQTRDLRKHINL